MADNEHKPIYGYLEKVLLGLGVKEPILPDKFRQLLDMLNDYAVLSSSCPIELDRSVWISGAPGVGKTVAVIAFRKLWNSLYLRSEQKIHYVTQAELSRLSTEAIDELCGYKQRQGSTIKYLILDDLMLDQEVVRYGERTRPGLDVVMARLSNRLRTVVTTNHDSITNDDRVAGRLMEYFTKVIYTGPEFRTAQAKIYSI